MGMFWLFQSRCGYLHCHSWMELRWNAWQQTSSKDYQQEKNGQNKSKSPKVALLLRIWARASAFLSRVPEINEIVSAGGNDTVGTIYLILQERR